MSVAAGWRPPRLRSLAGGLTVGLVERRQAPVVSTVLCYRSGAAAEPAALSGIAHFLEHMMFKGSAAYGPGEVDRLTQSLGGSNNAYTGHDATLYQFAFAAGRWHEALAVEADRMAGLRLEPREVEAERQVILEELSMVEDDPWDALELALASGFYGEHPYGRPVIGTRDSLRRITAGDLADLHRSSCRPDNAVLVVAGDVGEEALDEIEERFAPLAPPASESGIVEPAPRAAGQGPAAEGGRIELRRGELARLLVALPAPPAADAGYAPLRLLLTVLAGGRCSRLHHLLVEERRLCSSVGAEIDETVGPGIALLACELLPGAPPGEVEELLRTELTRLAGGGASGAEVERARRLLAADWVFARETVGQAALAAATAIALFDAEHQRRHVQTIETCTVDELAVVADAYLRPERAHVGWSLPEAAD